MNDKFVMSKDVLLWLAAVGTFSVIASLLSAGDDWVPGGFGIFCPLGVGMVVLANLFGDFRTNSWYTWDGPVTPTPFEAVFGLTGVTLFVSPLIALGLRFLWLLVFS